MGLLDKLRGRKTCSASSAGSDDSKATCHLCEYQIDVPEEVRGDKSKHMVFLITLSNVKCPGCNRVAWSYGGQVVMTGDVQQEIQERRKSRERDHERRQQLINEFCGLMEAGMTGNPKEGGERLREWFGRNKSELNSLEIVSALRNSGHDMEANLFEMLLKK